MNGLCSICGGHKRVHRSKQNNKLVCEPCYHRELHLEKCSLCGEMKSVRKRTKGGKAVCPNCYQQRFCRGICPLCKGEKPLVRMILGKMVCQSCCKKSLRWQNMSEAERIITELNLGSYRIKTRDPITKRVIEELSFVPPCYRGGVHGKSYDELGQEIAVLRFGEETVFGGGYDNSFDAFSQIEWLFSTLKAEKRYRLKSKDWR